MKRLPTVLLGWLLACLTAGSAHAAPPAVLTLEEVLANVERSFPQL